MRLSYSLCDRIRIEVYPSLSIGLTIHQITPTIELPISSIVQKIKRPKISHFGEM
jgi:hypothetical protein